MTRAFSSDGHDVARCTNRGVGPARVPRRWPPPPTWARASPSVAAAATAAPRRTAFVGGATARAPRWPPLRAPVVRWRPSWPPPPPPFSHSSLSHAQGHPQGDGCDRCNRCVAGDFLEGRAAAARWGLTQRARWEGLPRGPRALAVVDGARVTAAAVAASGGDGRAAVVDRPPASRPCRPSRPVSRARGARAATGSASAARRPPQRPGWRRSTVVAAAGVTALTRLAWWPRSPHGGDRRPADGRRPTGTTRRPGPPLGGRDSIGTMAPLFGRNALASSPAAVRVTFDDGTRAAVFVGRCHCWARSVFKVGPPLPLAAACDAPTRPSAGRRTPTPCGATRPTRHGGVGAAADHPALATTAVLPRAPSSRAEVWGERRAWSCGGAAGQQ